MSDPSLHARHRELMQKRQKDSLSRAIKNRRSVEELMKANIIKGPWLPAEARPLVMRATTCATLGHYVSPCSVVE